MADFEQLRKRFDDLSRRYEAAKGKKERFKGELGAKKRELADLSQEIKAAGYDPKTIKSERDKAEKRLVELLDQFEKDLTNVEDALSTYDEGQG